MGQKVNKKELAAIIGKTERTITDWQRLGLPMEEEGIRGTANTYDTEQVIGWLIDREIQDCIDNGEEDGVYNYERENARLTHHRANLAALDEKMKQGSLIPADTVKTVWCNIIANFRARILAIPTKAAHEFTAVHDLNHAQALLKDHLWEALTELADYDAGDYGITTLPTDTGNDGPST